ncbi:gustatory receptor 23a [Bactrocera dorsalis]|uniref:Gustatory receptor n=1 Tax=Bactrocera dorsalis TaxID=27457 RepID=A0ABM3JNK7_BACDO|nr:gustatory receptor 23a [Bactrocera dorsalis]
MAVGKRATKKSFKIYLFEFIRAFVNFGCVVFACRSFTKSQLIYKLYAGYWIIHITCVLLYSLHYELHLHSDMGGLMFNLLFIAQMVTHISILLESFFMDSKRAETTKIYKEFEKRFNKEFGRLHAYSNFSSESCLSSILSVLIVMVNVSFKIYSLYVYQLTLKNTLLVWHTLPNALAVQFRILELILSTTVLNEYAIILCRKLNEMGERNIRRVFGHYLRGLPVSKGCIIRVMSPTLQPSEEADEQKLRVYKKFYGDIYNMFKIINESHGWSLLAFMIMYFIYFTINSYWVIFSLIARLSEHVTLIRNLGFLVVVVTLLWILCWQSQNSQEQVSAAMVGEFVGSIYFSCKRTTTLILYITSRQIGCIMFKLVKPLGNKCYNDLVTDFSLQTLHQQYIITAKEFFNLNLTLLGSMVASIVTYLVILIQFMFAEKNKADRNEILSSIVNNENSTASVSN